MLVIPGLDGDAGLVQAAAPRLFPVLRAVAFPHRLDSLAGGVDGLAERALATFDADADADAPAFVCGESFGGTVALTLARRHPTRVRGRILLSAFGRYPPVSSRVGRLGLHLWRRLGELAGGPSLYLWRRMSLPGALGPACSRELARAYLGRPALHLPGYRAKCELALAFDARPWLGAISCPAFILIGSWDPIVPTRAGRELARLLPHARLHRLPGGHLVHVARPAEAGQLIAAWVADTSASSNARTR